MAITNINVVITFFIVNFCLNFLNNITVIPNKIAIIAFLLPVPNATIKEIVANTRQ